MKIRLILLLWLVASALCWAEDETCEEEEASAAPQDPQREHCPVSSEKPASDYPWKLNIVTTTFWVGEGTCGYNSTANYKSAWDSRWTKNFGGTDDPRDAKRDGLAPKKFAPRLNPFYVALPFNDVKYPKVARKVVPWWDEAKHKESRWTSQCKGRWVKIRYKAEDGTVKYCYGQWEDVGPFRYDHAKYVFGKERPKIHSKAGLDVSPAIATHLGLDGMEPCDWKFVEDYEVPPGPWLEYGEHAILYVAIDKKSKKR